MSTSPFQFAVDKVKAALATESTFRVLSVWRDPNDDVKTWVYPYLDHGTFPEVYQNGTHTGFCQYPFIIKAATKIDADSNDEGKGTEAAGIIIRKIMVALGGYDCEAQAENNDTFYGTKLYSMAVTDHDGHYDDGKGNIQVGVAALVTVNIRRL